MLIIGIDDAGRGPILGSMFLAGVLLNQEQEKELKVDGVADSKTLTHPQRMKLAGMIKDKSIDHKVVESTPVEIDHAVQTAGMNLNTLEAMKAADIINYLNKGKKEKIKVIIDCPSVNLNAWRNTLLSFVQNQDNLEVICEHKADANHPSVSAASILAKCAREECVAGLKNKYGETGSGYPSDPYTKAFLKNRGNELKDSEIFRKSWATWKALFPDAKQSVLNI